MDIRQDSLPDSAAESLLGLLLWLRGVTEGQAEAGFLQLKIGDCKGGGTRQAS